MEPEENFVTTRIVILWALLLIQLLTSQLTFALAPSNALPGCPQRCGDVEIPYPFGIGPNCSMEDGFTLNCTLSNGTYKPFLGNIEFLNISLSLGQARITNHVSSQCYNAMSRNVTNNNSWYIDLGGGGAPYRFSSTLNKFTTVGCDSLAYITVSNAAHGYTTGCVSLCEDKESLTNGSCSGIGCCQTTIPNGIDYYDVSFANNFNSTNTSGFSPCSYAVLVEESAFKFKTSYVTTGELRNRELPVVLDWAVRNKTCRQARRNRTSYACVSDNSECVDSGNGPGYLCNCSKGYQGNPYLPPHGCQGGYICSCPPGQQENPHNGACDQNQNQNQKLPLAMMLATSIGTSLLLILIIILCIYIICEKRKLIKVKENNFQEYGGKLLLEELGKQQGLGFKIFTEEELEQATNKFHRNNILGHGGYGTVYKGILKDNHVVAIKKTKIIDERQKKEFGKEMLILSQINHKNIVKLLGCCLQVEVPMLVYEYVSNGTLFQLIHRNSHGIHLSLEARLRIALESAEALAYLHSLASPPIIHGDIKSSNILLDDHFTAKVSDFGASMLAPRDEAQFVTLVQGTCGYLDPEYLQTYQLTTKSDVYSFGVVLLELITGKKALYFEGNEEETNLSSNFLSAMKENRFGELLDDRIKNDEEMERISEIAQLAKACLNVKGEERPLMKEVAEELDRLRKMKQHPWDQHSNPTEIESLLSNPSSYCEAEITSHYSLEKKAVLNIESG
ncbi:Wall-associated receptor kinase 2, partial [Ananas comosus]